MELSIAVPCVYCCSVTKWEPKEEIKRIRSAPAVDWYGYDLKWFFLANYQGASELFGRLYYLISTALHLITILSQVEHG